MKIKNSLYIYFIQLLLLILQIIQVSFILSYTISFKIFAIVLILAVGYSFVRYLYFNNKTRIYFYFYYLSIGIIIFIFKDSLINLINLESMNLNSLLETFFYVFEYALIRISFVSMIEFKKFYGSVFTSIIVLCWALISGRAMNSLLLLMMILVILILTLTGAQRRLEVYNKKVFVPIVSVFLISCLLSGIITPIFSKNTIDVFGFLINTSFNIIDHITGLFNVDDEYLETGKELMNVGVGSLDSLEVKEEKDKQEDQEEDENIKDSEDDKEDSEDNSENLNTSNDSNKNNSENSNTSNNSESTSSQTDGQSGSSGSADMNSTNAQPGLGNGSLTNATMQIDEIYTVLIVKSNANISRLKVYSGGYYDYNSNSLRL